MTFLEKTILLKRVDQLIRMKATGNARDLAQKLGVGKSTAYEIIDLMKVMGAEIEYDNRKKSFCYNSEKILAIGFVKPSMIKGSI